MAKSGAGRTDPGFLAHDSWLTIPGFRFLGSLVGAEPRNRLRRIGGVVDGAERYRPDEVRSERDRLYVAFASEHRIGRRTARDPIPVRIDRSDRPIAGILRQRQVDRDRIEARE